MWMSGFNLLAASIVLSVPSYVEAEITIHWALVTLSSFKTLSFEALPYMIGTPAACCCSTIIGFISTASIGTLN